MKHILALALAMTFCIPPAANAFEGAYWQVIRGKSYEAVGMGFTASALQKEFDTSVDEGHELTLLDAYEAGGQTYFNFVFRNRTSNKWAARFGLTGAQYQRFFDRQTDRGRCLRHLDVYKRGNQPRYLAIFKTHNCKAQRAYHGLSASDHQAKFDAWTGQGWDPVNVSVTSINGNRIYAAFYEKRPGGTFLKSSMTRNQMEEENAKQQARGRHIVYLDAYLHGNSPQRYSAIWRKVPKPALPWVDRVSQQMDDFHETAKRGRYVRYLTGFALGDSHRFSGALYRPQAAGATVGGISN